MNETYINAGDCQVEAAKKVKTFPTMSSLQIDKFFEKVDTNGPFPDQSITHYIGLDQCWVWTGRFHKKGYGTVNINRQMFLAHRVSKNLQSPFDPSLFALHHCDNPACVNPTHIFIGSSLENIQDRDSKGRGRWCKGIGHYSAKLTESDTVKIRELNFKNVSDTEIAKEFNVSRGSIYNIVHCKRWKHIK